MAGKRKRGKGKGKGQEAVEQEEKRHRSEVDWRDEPWEYKNDAYEAS